MVTKLLIKKWGNNLGVRLPANIVSEARLHADQEVKLSVENGKVIVESVTVPNEWMLDERLKRFDPDVHGGEAMATDRVGVEW